MISRRALVTTFASGVLLAPLTAKGQRTTPLGTLPSFKRGQWTAYGTNTFESVVYRNGSGHDMGIIKNASGGAQPDACFTAWCTADYDTHNDEMPMLLAAGHNSWSSNEVNTWAMATGAWRHDFGPTLNLIPSEGSHCRPGFYYPPNHPTCPAFYIDANNEYPNHAELDSKGRRAYPNMRHTYGGVTYMPTVKRFFLSNGSGWWAGQDTAFVPSEYDSATQKYRSLDLDVFTYAGITYQAWDTINSRVLVHDDKCLWAYNPTAPYGARMTKISAEEQPRDVHYNTMIFDAKRNRAFVFGAHAINTAGNPAGFSKYEFNANPKSTTNQTVTVTGDLTAANMAGWAGSGGRYDPLADRYVLWNGGKTLYFINPDTFVATAFTPADGATPTFPQLGQHGGGGCWQRFFYSPNSDVFGVVNHANEPFYIFAPTRTQPR